MKYPVAWATRRMRSSERPATHNWRPASAATRPMVWSRAALDAKVVTSTRPLALLTCSEQPGMDALLRTRRLVLEDVGRIAHEREDAAVADRGQRRRYRRGSPSTGVSSIFQSPVWKMLPNGVSISSPLPSGIECDKRDEGHPERAELDRPAALDDVELDLAGQPLLLELAGDQPGGERRREQRHLQFLGEIGQRADMVLVAVGQDDPGQPLAAASR